MAESYGRNIRAQGDAGRSQEAYKWAEGTAEEYLTPEQQAAYKTSRATYGAAMPVGLGFRKQRPEIAKREQALSQAMRLRDVAGTRALGAFEEKARTELSKPYKLKAEQGFIEGVDLGPDSMPEMTAHQGRMSLVDKKMNPEENTWWQRYENMRTGIRADDPAFKGFSDAQATADDARVQLREKFRAMRMGQNLPEIKVKSSGSKLKGYKGTFKDDPTGMIFDPSFKAAAVGIKMKGKSKGGILGAFKQGGPMGVMKETGMMDKLGMMNKPLGYVSDKMYDQMGYDNIYKGLPSAPSISHPGNFGGLYDELQMRPEDIYAGTWTPGSW